MKPHSIPRPDGKSLLSLLIVFMFQGPSMAQVIPYPGALNDAAVVQSSIDNVDTDAMVIGNGDINALIYAENDQLVLHLAKNDVWDARLVTEKDPPLLTVNVADHTWTGGGRPASWNEPYPTQTPPALVRIHTTGPVTNTKIDLRLAMASITVPSGKVTVRALAQKNVTYVETDRPVSLEGFPQSFLPAPERTQTGGVVIVKQHLPGDPDYAGMDVFSVLATRGMRHAIAIVTTRESKDALSEAIRLARGVLDRASTSIIQDHETLWRQFWSRSGVELADKDLQNWWYRQLYYLRCLSRPGAYAIALQGGYNSKANWHGTWTMNYNAEQTFWSAFSTNHVELSEPFIDLVNEFHPRARWYARTVFNCEGAASPHNLWPFEPDPEQCVSVNKRQLAYMPWSYGIGTAGHMAHNLWMHYLYTGDTRYLRDKIYPIIKDYALFYASFIEKCTLDNGKVVFGPSVDPEHTAFGWDNSPYDLAWAQHTLKAAVQGATDLGVDSDLVTRWSNSLDKLPYYPVSRDVVKVGDREEGYNIVTPIVPVFPAEQVSWFSQAREKDLFKRSIRWIDNRYNHNNSVVMMNVARARLSMTDEAWQDTKTWFKGKEQPNGLFYWQAHGFYMSEQTAVAGLITEFLIQSVDDIVRIFPAWPGDKAAEFSHLRTRGGFLVSARQKNGLVSDVTVESTVGGDLKLLSPWRSIKARPSDGRAVSLAPDALGIVTVSTKKGQTFQFVPGNSPHAAEKDLPVNREAAMDAGESNGNTKGIIDIADQARPAGARQLVGNTGYDLVPETDDVKCQWTFEEGVLIASPAWDSMITRESYRDFRMHVEFNVNSAPDVDPEKNGNSGVYIQQRYEIQILNSHGVSKADYKASYGGSLYRMKMPDQLVNKPAGQWQSYDIAFRAARFDGDKKVENARVTVYQNGQLIHDDVPLKRQTGAGQKEGPDPRPIKLQGHHNQVRFRNVWIQVLKLD